jgi:hypothetical protein
MTRARNDGKMRSASFAQGRRILAGQNVSSNIRKSNPRIRNTSLLCNQRLHPTLRLRWMRFFHVSRPDACNAARSTAPSIPRLTLLEFMRRIQAFLPFRLQYTGYLIEVESASDTSGVEP